MMVKRPWSVVAPFVVALAITACWPGTSAWGQAAETFRDEFVTITYSGNDGTSDFTGPWVERGESDGPSAGVVSVASTTRCSGGTGNCLTLGAETGSIEGIGVERRLDIDGADAATLRFSWRRAAQGQSDGSVRVRVAASGEGWSTLTTIPLTGAQGTRSEVFDITPHASSNTRILVEGIGTDAAGFLHLDDIEIEATLTPPTTTTTTAAATTTTTVAGTTTTTSTIPGATTTTTTTIPGATTTTTITIPGATTTTTITIPGVTVTTTTLPGETTTTSTVPGATGTTVPGTTVTAPQDPSTGDEASPPSIPDDGDPGASSPAEDQPSPTSSSSDGASHEAPPEESAALPGPVDDGGDSAGAVSPGEILAVVGAQVAVLGAAVGVAAVVGVGNGGAGGKGD